MTTQTVPSFAPTVQTEFNDLFLGKKLGEGRDREVYELAIDNTKVVKIENSAGSFQNVTEWLTWKEIEEWKPELKRWFAPCFWISFSGSVLIQARTTPLETLPELIPTFFTDLKRENWGQIDGKPVAHDYGLHLALIHGLANRLKKAKFSA